MAIATIPTYDPSKIPTVTDQANFHDHATYGWTFFATEMVPNFNSAVTAMNAALQGASTIVESVGGLVSGASRAARLNETNHFTKTGALQIVLNGDGEGWGRTMRLNAAAGGSAAVSYHSPGVAIWNAGVNGDGTFAFNIGGSGSSYGTDVAKVKADGDIWSKKLGNLSSSAQFAAPALRRTAPAATGLSGNWNSCPNGSFVTGVWRHPTSNFIDYYEWRYAQIQRRDGVWVTMVDG